MFGELHAAEQEIIHIPYLPHNRLRRNPARKLAPRPQGTGLDLWERFFFFFWALLIKTEFNYFLSIWLEKLPKGNY